MSGLAITLPAKLFKAFVVCNTVALSGPIIVGRFRLVRLVAFVMLRVKFNMNYIPAKTCISKRVFLSAI